MNSANSRAINNGQPIIPSGVIPDLIDKAPTDIGGIITGYLVEEFSTSKPTVPEEKAFSPEEEKVSAAPAFSWTMNSKLGLFNNFSLRSIAHELVSGNVDAAIRGVSQLKGDCPTLMHEICEITDHRGRKLKGTLLQLAAMNFDLNPCETATLFGAVERLVELDLLSDRDIKNQLYAVIPPDTLSAEEVEDRLEAVFSLDENKKAQLKEILASDLLSPEEVKNRLEAEEDLLPEEIKNRLDTILGLNCKKATQQRTDQRKAAVERLVDDIAALNINPNATWNEMRRQGDAIVQTFRAALNQEGVITEGLLFDLQILAWFTERFWGDDGLPGWRGRLGGWDSTKSDLLWAVGFGSLQAADSACGLQLHRQGIYKVVEEKKIPSRADHFSSGAPSFYAELGSSEFLSLYNGSRSKPIPLARPGRSWVYKNVFKQKQQHRKNLCGLQRSHTIGHTV